jgi:ketosteroid isomerase-like protein
MNLREENESMQSNAFAALALCSLLLGCAVSPSQLNAAGAQQQVLATERAFAKTMADRDLRAFASFIADEAVFFSGPKPLRGRQQITDWWTRYYATPTAPFSWEPEDVEVLESGALALSSGPVRDPQGKIVARFTSIWRREAPGTWRIIFDKGSEVCSCSPP